MEIYRYLKVRCYDGHGVRKYGHGPRAYRRKTEIVYYVPKEYLYLYNIVVNATHNILHLNSMYTHTRTGGVPIL